MYIYYNVGMGNISSIPMYLLCYLCYTVCICVSKYYVTPLLERYPMRNQEYHKVIVRTLHMLRVVITYLLTRVRHIVNCLSFCVTRYM